MKDPNPFEGLKRLRLPGMHLTTALDGGVPLDNALGAFFFAVLHDRYKHTCLITKFAEKYKKALDGAVMAAESSDGMALAGVFGAMGQMILYEQEWSYISNEDASPCLSIAQAATEQVQRWINTGSEKPFETGYGQLVVRPNWARDRRLDREGLIGEDRSQAKAYVDGLKREIESVPT